MSLKNLKKKIRQESYDVLNKIWSYYVENGEYIPEKVLKHELDKEEIITDKAITELGGNIVFRVWEDSKNRLKIKLPGLLLVNESERIIKLLSEYLNVLKGIYETNPETESIPISIIKDELSLDDEAINLLTKSIETHHMFGYLCGATDPNLRSISLPNELGNLRHVRDNKEYIYSIALENFRFNVSVDPHVNYFQLQNNSKRNGFFIYVKEHKYGIIVAVIITIIGTVVGAYI